MPVETMQDSLCPSCGHSSADHVLTSYFDDEAEVLKWAGLITCPVPECPCYHFWTEDVDQKKEKEN